MTFILAQADLGTLPANFVKNMVVLVVVMIVVASFAAAGLFSGLQYFLDKRSKKETQHRSIHASSPVPVDLVEGCVGRGEFDQHVQKTEQGFANITAEMKKDRQDNQVHASARSKTIFDEIKSSNRELERKMSEEHLENTRRITGVEIGLAAVKATNDLQNQKLAAVEGKVDNLPGKLIELLHRTGQLKPK